MRADKQDNEIRSGLTKMDLLLKRYIWMIIMMIINKKKKEYGKGTDQKEYEVIIQNVGLLKIQTRYSKLIVEKNPTEYAGLR